MTTFMPGQSDGTEPTRADRGAHPAYDSLVGRTGFEIELLAPRGATRETLADELAHRVGGSVRRALHADSEPSLVPDMGAFLTLTPAFEVLDEVGSPLCTMVDDVTLRADLDARRAPTPGWYRLLSDEPRLLQLVASLIDPSASIDQVLDPVARAFGVTVSRWGPVSRVDDRTGATVALAAPLPGERERPCEIVTQPLLVATAADVDRFLAPARDLGFVVPIEAAVHLHVDAEPFRTGPALSNVVRLFTHWRKELHQLLGTNPRCQRLAPLPPTLADLVDAARQQPWPHVAALARSTGAGKFFDVNLSQVVAERPTRHTLEVRILPGSLDAGEIHWRAALVEQLLTRCRQDTPIPRPGRRPETELLALASGGG